MYMRLNIMFLLFLAFGLWTKPLFSQSIEQIKMSGSYYFGVGEGPNLFTARNQARASLAESISVLIKSEFEHVIEETNDNINEYTTGVVSSYSTALIGRQDERVLSEEAGRVEVLVYITRESMNEIFRQREQLLRDFISQANRAEEEIRISDALRYYYWALILARSHPDNNKLRHVFNGTEDEPIMLGIYDRINRILSLTRADVKSIEDVHESGEKNVYITFTYRDQPIQVLDYSYWLGDGYSSLITVRDGMGIAILDGEAAREFENLRLRIEYQYHNKALLEPEVKAMMESVSIPYFAEAEKRMQISIPALSGNNVSSVTNQVIPKSENQTFSIIETSMAEYEEYKLVVEEIINAIRTSNHGQISQYFTAEAYKMYENLIASAHVKVLNPNIDTLRIIQMGNDVMVRSVPMLFSYENNWHEFVENLVIDFNEDKRISNISFALGQVAINNILARSEAFGSENVKFFLIRFMENYKTAFALKRIDYLNAIFDENALIIVGNIVKQSSESIENVNNMYGTLSKDQVEYIRLSKTEYIDRLRRIFRRNEFINIHFENNQVRKTQHNDKIYGIQISQHYHSSTYADKGYLFLMIDLNDSLNPKIYVRTWQPRKNDDGTIYGLEDFKF